MSDNAIKTKEGNLILDSHKLSYHYERVKAWENGEKIAPVCVDMALTRACGAMCSFCYAMVQEPQERASIKTKDALNLLQTLRGTCLWAIQQTGKRNLCPCAPPHAWAPR